MNRGIVAALLAGLLAAGLWATFHFATWRTERIHTGFEPEAIRNPLLGAQRLLERMGRRAAFQEDLPPDAQAVNPVDTFVMVRRSHGFSPQQARRLEAFVEQGGLLVLEADSASIRAAREQAWLDADEKPFVATSLALRDPLLERLGIAVVGKRPPKPEKEETGSAPEEDKMPEDLYTSAELRLREGEPPFLVDADPWIGLADREHPARARRSDETSIHFLREKLGKGRVLVFTDLGGLTNRRIVKRDHAELLWNLVKDRPAEGRIWLLAGTPSTGLLDWLGQHAWMVLLSLGSLLAFVGWKAAHRFGPLLPVPDPARRDLLEHVDASGRLLWQEGAGDRLVKATRAALLLRIERTHPAWASLPLPKLQGLLADFSGLPAPQLFRALFEDHFASPAEFTAAIRTLETLRKLL